MYTRCFFRNIPEVSCTFWAKPRWTFFAVVVSTLVDLGAGLIAVIKVVHLRKSFSLAAAVSTGQGAYSCDILRLTLYLSLFGCTIRESW